MKVRISLAAVLTAVFAVNGFAVPGDFIDWVNGPARFLMTAEESASWTNVRTEEEADAFVNLFWARRDPTPDTPRNEFREEFERRVIYADRNLQAGSAQRGSLTDQGKTLILYGPPKRILRSSREQRENIIDRGRDLQETQRETRDWVEWIYEEDPGVTSMFGVPRATIRFVDKLGRNDFTIERGTIDLAAAQLRAANAAITQPDLTEAPQVAAADPAAADSSELTDDSLKTAIAKFRTQAAPTDTKAAVVSGEYVTSSGERFIALMLSMPAGESLAAGTEATFFGSITDESGAVVGNFQRLVTLKESKGDVFADHSMDALAEGKYRGVFGLARKGQPLVLVASDLDVPGTAKAGAAGVSQLILSNNIYPLEQAQQPTEPFAFGGLKVIPKADGTFRRSEELWFFVELRNPGIAERALSADVVPITAAEAATPVIQVKLDVEGVGTDGKSIRRGSPPREIQPVAIRGVPGHYGVGDSIPLESFAPGNYTMQVKLVDTVRKASYTLSHEFRVVE